METVGIDELNVILALDLDAIDCLARLPDVSYAVEQSASDLSPVWCDPYSPSF